MIIPSFFEQYAEQQNLQAMLDTSLDVLQGQSIWRTFLDEGIPKANLNFETIIGRSRIEAAGSIVDPDAPAPERSRNTLETYPGKIPTIKEKFRLSQADMRALMTIQESTLSSIDNRGVQALIKALYDDVSKAAVAGDKRVDIMLLQAISTLKVDLSATWNPDGAAFGTVDYLAKPYQSQGVPVVWTDHANATVVDDIEFYINNIYKTFGRSFGKLVVSQDLWLHMKRNTQLINNLKGFFNIGKGNATYAITLPTVNEYFQANGWPPLSVVNHVVGIESDGIITPYRPFNANNVAFIPDGKLGILENAYPMEVLKPVMGKSYAHFGPTLVSKWMDDDPLVEWTGMEMNAFPSLTAIDGIFILQTNVVQAVNTFVGTTGQ